MMPCNIKVQVYLTIFLTFIYKIYAQMAGQLHKLHVNKLTLALAASLDPVNFALQIGGRFLEKGVVLLYTQHFAIVADEFEVVHHASDRLRLSLDPRPEGRKNEFYPTEHTTGIVEQKYIVSDGKFIVPL